MPWYGAKSIYETTVVQRAPSSIGPDGSRLERLIEERVVLFCAQDSEEALAQAEAEARRYAQGPKFQNADGELVETRYLGCLDVFTISGEPGDQREVYSSLRVVRNMGNQELADILLGPDNVEDRRKYEPKVPTD